MLEICRESGVLLMALGPLEAALNRDATRLSWAEAFGFWYFVIGLAISALALFLEWRFVDAE